MTTGLDQFAKEVHATAVEKGFWNDEVNAHFVLAKLALVTSEVSEVLEAYRKEQGSYKIVEEMADIVIRLVDLYEGLKEKGVLTDSLDSVLYQKANVNRSRPKLHGNLL